MKDPACSARTSLIAADVFTHPFAPSSFDLVTANAMLHHVDAERGLRRMRELVRPGGVLAIVGFAMPSDVRDRALIAAGPPDEEVGMEAYQSGSLSSDMVRR